MAVRVVAIVGIFAFRVTRWVGEDYRVHGGSVAEVAADEEPGLLIVGSEGSGRRHCEGSEEGYYACQENRYPDRSR